MMRSWKGGRREGGRSFSLIIPQNLIALMKSIPYQLLRKEGEDETPEPRRCSRHNIVVPQIEEEKVNYFNYNALKDSGFQKGFQGGSMIYEKDSFRSSLVVHN